MKLLKDVYCLNDGTSEEDKTLTEEQIRDSDLSGDHRLFDYMPSSDEEE